MTDKHQPHHYERFSLEDIGTLLREAREREGLTKTDVSSRTKITMEQLNTLEDGRPPKIASVYARGFLRTYSELVQLENADVVYEAYKHLTTRNDEDFDKPLTSKYIDNKLLSENPTNTLSIVIAVLVVLVLGLIGLYVSPSFRAKAYGIMPESLRAKLPAFEQTTPAPAEATAEAAPAQSAPANPPAQTTPTLAEAAVPEITQTPPAVAKPDPEPEPEPAPEIYSGRLTLRAEKDTWAQVIVDNQPMEHLIFRPGESKSFDGLNSVDVLFGDGQALRMEWNGQDRGYVGGEGPDERIFPLTPPET